MLIEYFKSLYENFPVDSGKRHCIIYDNDTKQLKIGVWYKDQMITIEVESEDEFKDVNEIISDIKSLMRPWTHSEMPNV